MSISHARRNLTVLSASVAAAGVMAVPALTATFLAGDTLQVTVGAKGGGGKRGYGSGASASGGNGGGGAGASRTAPGAFNVARVGSNNTDGGSVVVSFSQTS